VPAVLGEDVGGRIRQKSEIGVGDRFLTLTSDFRPLTLLNEPLLHPQMPRPARIARTPHPQGHSHARVSPQPAEQEQIVLLGKFRQLVERDV
jgi:hypothetical protein